MSTIGVAISRLEDTVTRRPEVGAGTTACHTTLEAGLRCVTEEAGVTVATDLPAALGGGATAPTPSALMRAALGSCMAMSYRLRAERDGVDLGAIAVTVETDSALAGMLLACGLPPGFTAVRYQVEIQGSAPAGDVLRILDAGDRLSPVLDVFTRAIPVTSTRTLRPAEG